MREGEGESQGNQSPEGQMIGLRSQSSRGRGRAGTRVGLLVSLARAQPWTSLGQGLRKTSLVGSSYDPGRGLGCRGESSECFVIYFILSCFIGIDE